MQRPREKRPPLGAVGRQDLEVLEGLLRHAETECHHFEARLRQAEEAAKPAAAQQAEAEFRLAWVERRLSALAEEKLAVRQVVALTKAQLGEVKSFKTSPPAIVRRAMESIWVLLHCKQWAQSEAALNSLDPSKEWGRIQRMLAADGFVQSVTNFAASDLDAVPWVVEYLRSHYFPDLSPESSSSPIASDVSEASHTAPRSLPGSPLARSGSTVLSSSGSTSLIGNGARPSMVSGTSVTSSPSAPSTPSTPSRKAASLKSAGLSTVGAQRLASKASISSASAPLDLDAVDRASKVCGVLVRWCLEVLREFSALQALRAERREASSRAASAASELTERQSAVETCSGLVISASSECDLLRDRLADLRQKAADAEKALRDLARLESYEEQFSSERVQFKQADAPTASQLASEMATLGDFMRLVQEHKAADNPLLLAKPCELERPSSSPKAELMAEEDAEIVVEVGKPLTESSSGLTEPGGRPTEASSFSGTRQEADWWVECGYNESNVCQRGSPFLKSQQRACAELARHLVANPDTVVLLEGNSSGRDEDPDISQRRAESLAAWLRQHSVRSSQLRFQMPQMPLPVKESLAGMQRAAGDTGEDHDSEAETDGDDSDSEEDETGSSSERLPERRISAKPLRLVRIREGPCEGDAEQRKQPGLFFAPEDASLDSLGQGLPQILRKVGQVLRQLVIDEGCQGLVVEGHADEGIQDDQLLHTLAAQRAEAVCAFLFDFVCQPQEKPDAEDEQQGESREECPAKGNAVARAATKLEDLQESGVLDNLLQPEPPSGVCPTDPSDRLLRPEALISCSRGRSCRFTEEFGLGGLNRRVQIFIM